MEILNSTDLFVRKNRFGAGLKYLLYYANVLTDFLARVSSSSAIASKCKAIFEVSSYSGSRYISSLSSFLLESIENKCITTNNVSISYH
ncbi:unnamed protein product [Rotaria sp. Silwood2]|nr:unnamed protein product [Rotaria sp. Silwood2]